MLLNAIDGSGARQTEHDVDDACQEEAGVYTIAGDVSSMVLFTASARTRGSGSIGDSIGDEKSRDSHI